ncbi:acetolactate synthase small subunit [Salinarimonas rosea]|uniref:acetolactate synthase small subunit n=1 Tax=Salinarimonas rosea TaxID=552063 RepID=UPI0004286CCD|nr:acetolactate synthase small subunit [Salinarimonas rosea]
MNQTHYPAAPVVEAVNRHTLAVIVDNEPGVLARIAGLFSGRGYNIESLTVSETHHETHVSRITIVTAGTAGVIEQIKAHLERLVPVHRVDDLTVRGEALERELCLVKVVGEGDHRVEALRLASAFGARTLDATLTSFVFELTGASEDIERFVKLMAGVGLVEVARTGVAAMSRGAEAMEN